MIVVDTSPFFHGPMLATLDRTDELLMLCGLDVPTLKNVRLALQTLDLLSFPTGSITFMLNRANSKVGMKKKEVERRSRRQDPLRGAVGPAVLLGVNRGVLPAVGDTGSDFACAMREIAAGRPKSSRSRRGGSPCSRGRDDMGLHDRISKQNGNGAAARPPSVRSRLPAPLSPPPRLIPGR